MASPARTADRSRRRPRRKPRVSPKSRSDTAAFYLGGSASRRHRKSQAGWESTADALPRSSACSGPQGPGHAHPTAWSRLVAGTVGACWEKRTQPAASRLAAFRAVRSRPFSPNSMDEVRRAAPAVRTAGEIGARFLHFHDPPMRLRPGTEAIAGPRAVLVVNDAERPYRAQDASTPQLEPRARVRARTQALPTPTVTCATRSSAASRRSGAACPRAMTGLHCRTADRAQEGERSASRGTPRSVGNPSARVKYTLERGLELLPAPAQGAGDSAAVLNSPSGASRSRRGYPRDFHESAPEVLDDLGAASAVQWFSAISRDLSFDRHCHGADRGRPRGSHARHRVYRCVQELLNNVAKQRMPATYWSSCGSRRAC